LFFDELDAILGCDENNGDHSNGMGRVSSSSAEARVLSTFLNEMDGVDGSWKDGVLVLGATNRPGTLDAALLRPGRFDKIIYVPPPDYQGRRSILSMQCKKWPCRIDVDHLAEEHETGMMTGAEISPVHRDHGNFSRHWPKYRLNFGGQSGSGTWRRQASSLESRCAV
jgi:transitional endoplasmic reticulum ATPase